MVIAQHFIIISDLLNSDFDLVAFYLSRSTNFLKIPVPGCMGVYSTDHCSLAVNIGGALIACEGVDCR